MALIIYFPNPLDAQLTVEDSESKTIREALKKFEIEREQLCVVINGEVPDYVDLDKRRLPNDMITVHHVVEGSSNDKNNLATVIQIGALIALTMIPGAGWAVLAAKMAIVTGASLAAGALRANAVKLDTRSAGDNGSNNETDITSDSYSLSNANNEPRPLQPVPLCMGSMRYAPDVLSGPYLWTYGSEYKSTSIQLFSDNFNPGIVSSNGPEASINSWALMPANYIYSGLPRYPIKIAPYGFTSKTTSLTSAENTAIIDQVKTLYSTTTGFVTINPYDGKSDAPDRIFPIIIFHSDPSDPHYRKYNALVFLHRIEVYGPASYPGWMTNLFDGTLFPGGSSAVQNFLFINNIVDPDTYLLNALEGSNLSLPSSAPYSPGSIANIRNWLLAINNGNYSAAKTQSYDVQSYFSSFGATSFTKSGIPMSTQLFDYGIGDLTISERNVGVISVLSDSPTTKSISYVENKITSVENDRWLVGWNVSGFYKEYSHNVTNFPDKQLINIDSPTSPISQTDMGQYNFSYFKCKPTQNTFNFNVTGRIYTLNGSTFSANSIGIQAQWKASGDAAWRDFRYPVLVITNDNTKTVDYNYSLSLYRTQFKFDIDRLETEYIEVRIRKLTLDSANEGDTKIADLSLTKISSYTDEAISMRFGLGQIYAPRKIDGLWLTGIISDASVTSNYSALVRSKCWAYNFETELWSWTFTRNPAFWFLYFARGGYRNEPSRGQYAYPYSPTQGWVNYPGHPNSTDLMFGCGLYDSEIDVDKILEWAFYCQDHELFIDTVVRQDATCAEVLENIANCGRGSVSYYSGKLSIVYEDPEHVPVCMYGMSNIIAGSFGVEYMVGEPIRTIKLSFTNRDTWESETIEAIVPFSDPDNVNQVEVTLDGVTEYQQAYREAQILAARQFYQKRFYSWESDTDGYLARRGDLVYLSHDSTQYDISGRVINFIFNDVGAVIGIEHGSIVKDTVNYITIRYPNNTLETYECEASDGKIMFLESYPLEVAPYNNYSETNNEDSLFLNSVPEDFIFIAGPMETTGKIVRISSVEGSENGRFKFSAVDEDPAMWAYEYGNPDVDLESFDDSRVVLEVDSANAKDLGEGLVKVNWNITTGDYVQIFNTLTGLPIESGGKYSFSSGEAILELSPNAQYNLEVRPFAIGTPYKSIGKKIKIWLA